MADQYMIMMAVTLLFTVLSLAYSRNVVLGLLAAVSWMISALGHFAVGDQTSTLTSALGYMFLLFAILFAVKTIIYVAGSLHEKRWSTELD